MSRRRWYVSGLWIAGALVLVLLGAAQPHGVRTPRIGQNATATGRLSGPEGSVLAFWAALTRHDPAAAYRLVSPRSRQEMARAGLDQGSLAAFSRQVLALTVEKWQPITPAHAARGPRREIMVVLRLHGTGARGWSEGLNVRYVQLVRSTSPAWLIDRVEPAPIPF